MTRASFASAFLVSPLALACSLVNSLEPCEEVRPEERRVNERGDFIEYLDHPKAAAEIAGNRVAVAFAAQSPEITNGRADSSAVRLAMLDASSGERVPLGCVSDSESLNRTLTPEYAYMPAVTRADLDVNGSRAVALVSWFEGRSVNEPILKVTFVDAIGCPLGLGDTAFSPHDGPVFGASVAWSPQRGAVLATFHDGRDVYRAWIDAFREANVAVIGRAERATIHSAPVAAVADDGRVLVAWIDRDDGVRGVFLDASGDIEDPGLGVDLGFPSWDYPEGVLNRVTVTSGGDRFAVLLDASDADAALPQHVYVREFRADGAALGPAKRLDGSDDRDRQTAANAVYLPSRTLLTTWKSASHEGTMGRLFRSDGGARFNSLSCSEASFAVGSREEVVGGWAVPLAVGNQAWVVHGADVTGDSRGGGVASWRIDFAELWPAESAGAQ